MTMGSRLKDARINAGFRFATEAAERFNWNVNTYRSHENGSADYSFEFAQKYAKAFKVNAYYLYDDNFIGDKSDSDVNILLECGYVDAGLTSMFVDQSDIQNEPERIEWVNGRDKVALRVRGVSMLPDYKPNSLLVFGYVKPLGELVNKDILAKLSNGAVLVKKLRRGENGTWKLESTNSEYDPIEDAQIIEARAVEAILLR